jgi:Rieske Fe-S protein
VSLVPRAPLEDFDTGPCLRFARQGQFHPLRYLGGLAQAITRAGGCVVTGCHVVATNSPINDRVKIHTKQAAYVTYVVALRVPRDFVTRALYWDTHDPYHYVRLLSGSDRDDEVLIVGGEDHKTGQAHDHEERFRRLERWARERFPRAGAVTHRWSGQVLETIDGLGFIGRNPGDRHVYIATGDSGMGMTHGTIAGMLLTDLILQRPNPWADLYDPSRKPFGTVREFLRENVNAAAQYTAWLTPGEVSAAEDIAPGTGAIVREGLEKLAIYRDERGVLFRCSAVCPHLSAVVSWNPAEKTWDCPAHGSRFDCHGAVIQGPANTGLKPAPEPAARP